MSDTSVRRSDEFLAIADQFKLGVLVTEAGAWGRFEEELLLELQRRRVPVVVVFNKVDVEVPDPERLAWLAGHKIRHVETAAAHGLGLDQFRQALLDLAPADFINSPAIVGDLVGPGELALLVVPIDKEAPKGRLILPQVQAIRDLLDHDAYCLVVKEHQLRRALDRLKSPPRLVVTDSQAFEQVAAETPRSVPLTSFSILMSRFKGDLAAQVEGALAIDSLRPGDRVLVAESCSHHPIGEDIGRVKIPRWLNTRVGGEVRFDHVQGHDFPADLSRYRLVIHCGACMFNRREMLTRILRCQQAGVPVTNYGLAIAFSLGILERALEPFPAVLAAVRNPPGGGSAQPRPLLPTRTYAPQDHAAVAGLAV